MSLLLPLMAWGFVTTGEWLLVAGPFAPSFRTWRGKITRVQLSIFAGFCFSSAMMWWVYGKVEPFRDGESALAKCIGWPPGSLFGLFASGWLSYGCGFL